VPRRSFAPLLLAAVAILLGACAGTSSGPLTAVPITDFAMVAGKWGGLVMGITPQQEDWVDVIIMSDGKYDFGIYRTIGVFAGKGAFTLKDGKLQARGQRGSATYTLYEGGDRRVLRVQGTLADGRAISARLNPKE
jgi:hypothetical protein